jgi:hypothetical protein
VAKHAEITDKLNKLYEEVHADTYGATESSAYQVGFLAAYAGEDDPSDSEALRREFPEQFQAGYESGRLAIYKKRGDNPPSYEERYGVEESINEDMKSHFSNCPRCKHKNETITFDGPSYGDTNERLAWQQQEDGKRPKKTKCASCGHVYVRSKK